MSRRAYASGTSEVPLRGDTIGECLIETAEKLPKNPALVSLKQGIRLTYRELEEESALVAKALIAAGIEVGDRVGLWSPNCAEWTLVQYGAARAGAILVNINPAYRSSELSYVLTQSGSRTLIAAPSFKTSDYEAIVEEVRGETPLEDALFLGTTDWEKYLRMGRTVDDDVLVQREARLDADDPINIQYTSGTTGFPKGATLSHHNLLNNGFFVGEGCALTASDSICLPVPYYHCFGMSMGNLAAVSHGACVVLPDQAFEPRSVLAAVEAEQCTALYGVPTMFIAELDLPDFSDFDLSSLRTGIMAGSPCPIEVMERVIREMGMTEVTICYGMTETSPVSTQTLADDDIERRVSTVGCVHPHLEIRVADSDTGRTVDRGVTGEFQTRGYSVMLGYWNDPDRTAESIDSARWMHTGDQAVMDDDGYARIVGRIKDMIIRGGENIYPREIEEFLYQYPAIADVQVVGVPDERYGEEVMAWIIPKSDEEFDEEDVRQFCRKSLAHYKVPRYVRTCSEFPMTVTGKVKKDKLRALARGTLEVG